MTVEPSSLSLHQLRERFDSLRQWKINGQRAPHKPLLALWAIGRCLQGKPRLVRFNDAEQDLLFLLQEFGPYRKVYHPQYPFWRMRQDSIWEIPDQSLVNVTASNDAFTTQLRSENIAGGFPNSIYEAFQEEPKWALKIAEQLLESHFPDTRYQEILDSVGISQPLESEKLEKLEIVFRQRRNPKFRFRVLQAYQHRCAICGFSVRLHHRTLALEAAHIKWHHAGGPDKLPNGLALCSLHHKLFDSGAFTINSNLKVIVAKIATGDGYLQWLGNFHSQNLQNLSPGMQSLPSPEHLNWHNCEVFRGPME